MKLLKIIFFLVLISSNTLADNNYFNEGLVFYESMVHSVEMMEPTLNFKL